MSVFINIINQYSEDFNLSSSDRLKLIVNYPFFKMMHSLEYGGATQKIASIIYGFVKNHKIKHGLRVNGNTEIYNIDVPFDRYDHASFREIFMGKAYQMPDVDGDIETIVDLGGNIGLASLYFGIKNPKLKKLIVVEANPKLIKKIQDNLKVLRCAILVENFCISDRDGDTASFMISKNHRESSSEGSSENSVEKIEMPTVTLRTLLKKHSIGKADLLKMDIEGGEYDVMKDAEILKTFRYLFIEIHGDKEKRNAFIETVASLGFSITRIDPDSEFPCETILGKQIS